MLGWTPVDAQPRQLGGLVLGRGASLGPERAQRRRRDLRHRGGLPQALRDGGVLVGATPRPPAASTARTRAPCAASGSRSSASRSCTSTRTATTPRPSWAASGWPRARAPTAPWCSPSPTCGSPRDSTTASTWPSAPWASRNGGSTSSGEEDGVPKTPEWQEAETGVPAREVRALARAWGTKRTYLAAGGLVGFGGACRTATGIDWARGVVCLMAMQGLGKPGVNMGCLQQGTPLDTHFFFPGYAEGGYSGDLYGTALSINMYQRMPQLATVNTVSQVVPRLKIPEAVLDGHCEGYPTDPRSIEGQFMRYEYPAPGHSEGEAVLQVRRLAPWHDDRHQPLRAHVPLRQAGVRGEPGHLVRGRDQVRGRHPAGLHQLRALGYQRVRQLRGLHPARLHAVQSPRDGDAAQVHRAARGVAARTTRSSSTSPRAWAWGRCTRRGSPSSTGASGCSTPPTCPGASPGRSS